jgi:hypothetical protein
MSETYRADTPRNRDDSSTPHTSPVTPSEDVRTVLINKISWGAVFAGVVLTLVLQLLLNLIGIGIGASTLDPANGDSPTATTFSVSAGIWWALSSIIAAFIGGYVASRLSGRPVESTGGWHGLICWATTTLILFYLLTSAVGSLAGGAFSTVSAALGGLRQTATSAAQTAAPGLATLADPFRSIEQTLQSSTGNEPAELRNAAIAAMRALVTGDQSRIDEARERAAQALARAQSVDINEARTRVSGYERQYQESADRLKQQAREAADTAATAVSRGALLGSIALLLGAIAAWFGGRMGAVDPTVTARHLGGMARYARRASS